jgi:hypothetical protein
MKAAGGFSGKAEATPLADQIRCLPDLQISSLRVGRTQSLETGDTGMGGNPEVRMAHCRIVQG